MKEVATNPFFEERTASTKDLAKEKIGQSKIENRIFFVCIYICDVIWFYDF